MKTTRLSSLILIGLISIGVSEYSASAATMISYTASADPAAGADANADTANAWTVNAAANSGSFFGSIDGNLSMWTIFSTHGALGTEPAGIVTQTHAFAGGPLTAGQSVSLDYAHAVVIDTGTRVGIRLLNALGMVEVEFSFLGGTPTAQFARRDARV